MTTIRDCSPRLCPRRHLRRARGGARVGTEDRSPARPAVSRARAPPSRASRACSSSWRSSCSPRSPSVRPCCAAASAADPDAADAAALARRARAAHLGAAAPSRTRHRHRHGHRRRKIELSPVRDYIVQAPGMRPLKVTGGLRIEGGRNVVVHRRRDRRPTEVGGAGARADRAVFLKNQTGTIHVEGVRISGKDLAEGIDLDQREGATVVLQNIAIDTVQGSRDGHHADVLQSWAGPANLRIDGLDGSTEYQGFFLLPQQFVDTAPRVVRPAPHRHDGQPRRSQRRRRVPALDRRHRALAADAGHRCSSTSAPTSRACCDRRRVGGRRHASPLLRRRGASRPARPGRLLRRPATRRAAS